MRELIDEIIEYMNYLKRECSLDVTVHFDKLSFLEFPEYAVKMLLHYNQHSNPFCIMVKSMEKGHRKCMFCQIRIIKKCAEQTEFCGVCHAGVSEYIHAVKSRERAVGFVSVSGYRKNGANTAGLFSEYYRQCLSEEPIPVDVCRIVIPPLCRMFELFLSTIPERGSEGSEYHLMLRFIYEHHNKMELADLCRAFHRSPSYVSHMFKQKSGMTLRAYCNRLKIEDAKRLLLASDFPITEAAFAVGFSDVSYFIHIFKKITGETPLKWRKLNK